ncbi:MAG: hypothetical protein ABR526_03825 [Chthoniobacterales bacterium]
MPRRIPPTNLPRVIGDLLLLGALVLSIVPIGLCAVRLTSSFRGLDLIGFGVAAGVVVQAGFGLLIACLPAARALIVWLDAAVASVALLCLWRWKLAGELRRSLSPSMRLGLVLWLAFAVLAVTVTHVTVTLPRELPDWRFIFKKPTLNVRLQHLTSLPADNFIPYAVTEYILRGISFARERPILPGNEVSNRTILLSLVALPYRVAISPPAKLTGPLGTFEFVGKQWPDVAKLYEEESYREVLVVGIFLNSLLLLGCLVVFEAQFRDPPVMPCALMLCITNSYLVAQTVFIWPKAVAGFFLLLAWRVILAGRSAALAGLCLALAYHCHPYAGIFAVGLGGYYITRARWRWAEVRPAVLFLVAFLVVIAPWLLWTCVVLHMSSDLLWQNVAGEGTQEALASPIAFIWIRAKNLYELVAPTMFAVYPVNASQLADAAQVSLPGAVGLILIFPAFAKAFHIGARQSFYWLAIGLPALFIVMLFSYYARPIFHGYQPIVAALVFLGVIKLRETLPSGWFCAAVLLQLALNLATVLLRAYVTGVHFS